MEAIEEKKICVVGGTRTRSRDRISSLPDFILHHILSFLDIKFAVQTSILSKRWRNVWRSTPDLVFRFSIKDYIDPMKHHGDALNNLHDEKKFEFSNLIEKVLDGRDGFQINKFVFECDIDLEPSFIKSILCRIARQNVREIELSPVKEIQFPRCLHTCETLEKLKLVKRDWMVFPTSMGFQALKELRLHGFYFSGNDHSDEMFPRCPVLEFLSLVKCSFSGVLATISAPRLKKMELLYPRNFTHVKVCAPMLSYFKFEGHEPMKCLMDANMISLEEVDIDIQADLDETEKYKYYHQNPVYREVDIADRIFSRKKRRIMGLLEMLKEFRDAKSVIISLKTIEVLSDIPNLLEGEASPFSNLKNIKLKTVWPMLSAWNFLLKDSPDAKASLQGSFARLTSGSCKCNCKN